MNNKLYCCIGNRFRIYIGTIGSGKSSQMIKDAIKECHGYRKKILYIAFDDYDIRNVKNLIERDSTTEYMFMYVKHNPTINLLKLENIKNIINQILGFNPDIVLIDSIEYLDSGNSDKLFSTIYGADIIMSFLKTVSYDLWFTMQLPKDGELNTLYH